jgi:putative hemolysin
MQLPDPPASGPGRDIVDQLIAERAPNLVPRPLGLWLLRRLLYPILSYREAVALAELVRSMPGRAIFRLLEELLEIRTRESGLEQVPAKGPVILVGNHPTGLADGIAVAAALRDRRANLLFLTDADALRVAPGLADLVVPVEWVQAERSRAKARELPAAVGRLLDEGGALVISPPAAFPVRAGAVSPNGLGNRPRSTSPGGSPIRSCRWGCGPAIRRCATSFRR